ncbi:MAG: 16S rRNA (cytosine(1402)-N(4))-methyltransferase RsmH [Rickettsiales bacterium]|nr:16S rRNA (cytosine(1402)-N(4))-methyltransferase RsmH [Rickettsiales bacterium]
MHIPVMLNEVIRFLSPVQNYIYIDATFGAGGYSKEILASKSSVYAFDVDPTVEKFASKLEKEFGDRFKFINSNYSNIKEELNKIDPKLKVDGIVYDLGVSSMQLDQRERGFSFNKDAKLDMRMGIHGQSAYDVVNNCHEAELADIIYHYGDEKKARRIAKNIVDYRAKKKIETTSELRSLVLKSVKFDKFDKIDPATKTFQAIRIFVNDELGNLEKSLAQISSIIKPGGLIVIVTFHSIEDRIVKQFFKEKSGAASNSRYAPQTNIDEEVTEYKIITKKPISPSEIEIHNNPRARSAKLRVYERLQ